MRLLVTISLTLLATLLSSCDSAQDDPSQATLPELRAQSEGKEITRVVLVTIDTMRADHLGAYGYPRPISPFIDWLAETGMVFDNAFTIMPTTVPAHSSLFTSRYPMQHGVRKNGQILEDTDQIMARIFRDNGFDTAGFSAVSFILKSGLDQGFNHVDLPKDSEKKLMYRPAQFVVDAVLDWRNSRSSTEQKEFLWVHVFDPHAPYSPPRKSKAVVNDFDDWEEMVDFLKNKHLAKGGDNGVAKKMDEQIDSYDAEVHYTDQQLRRLYEGLSEDEVGTLWIITADHGEGLGTHGFKWHGSRLFNEQLRIPMIFHATNGELDSGRRNDIVEITDVLPTLIDLMELESPVIEDSFGCSFYPLLVSGKQRYCEKTMAFAERRVYDEPSNNYEKGAAFAAQTLEEKLITQVPGKERLFQLTTDAYEQQNLAQGQWTGTAQELKALMSERLELLMSYSNETEAVDQELIEQLRSLGYIQ